MNHYLTEETYSALLADLSDAFMAAATTTGADLRDKLVEALAVAGVMPECCRENCEGVELLNVAD